MFARIAKNETTYKLGKLTDAELKGKCHECEHYIPLVKSYFGIKDVKHCRGECGIHYYKDGGNVYKARMETCNDFKKGGIKMKVANRLLDYRKKCKATQTYMCLKLGVSLVTYQNWERGITTPKLVNMDRIEKLMAEK